MTCDLTNPIFTGVPVAALVGPSGLVVVAPAVVVALVPVDLLELPHAPAKTTLQASIANPAGRSTPLFAIFTLLLNAPRWPGNPFISSNPSARRYQFGRHPYPWYPLGSAGRRGSLSYLTDLSKLSPRPVMIPGTGGRPLSTVRAPIS